jgi:hypothetical protein
MVSKRQRRIAGAGRTSAGFSGERRGRLWPENLSVPRFGRKVVLSRLQNEDRIEKSCFRVRKDVGEGERGAALESPLRSDEWRP